MILGTFDLDNDTDEQRFLDQLCWWLYGSNPSVAALVSWSDHVFVSVFLHPDRGSVIDMSTLSLSVSVDGERVEAVDPWVQRDAEADGLCPVRDIFAAFGFSTEERMQAEARFDEDIAAERRAFESKKDSN
jgi:hypothetical protein